MRDSRPHVKAQTAVSRFNNPFRIALDLARRQRRAMQEHLRHVSREPMHVVAGLWKIGSREFMLGHEFEHFRVD
jgi:hypothetical protein